MNTLQPLVDFYENHKWKQGDYVASSHNSFCLVNAALNELTASGKSFEMLDEIERRIGSNEIINWNDTHGRTFEEVMEMLKREDTP